MDKGRLNEIFNEASEAVVIFGRQGELLYFNTAVEHLLQQSSLELEGKNLFDLIEADIHEEIRTFVGQTDPPQKQILEQKAFVYGKDKQEIPVSFLLSTITHDKGNIHMMVIEPLVAANSSVSPDYKLLADNLPEVVSLYDAQGRCMYVNPAVRNLYGYRQPEYLGIGGFAELVTEEDREALHEKIHADTLKKVTLSDYTYRAYQSRGETIWIQNTIKRVFDHQGKLKHLLAYERSAVQRAMHQPEQETIATPLLLLDTTWNIIFASQEAANAVGPLNLSGTHFTKLLHPEDATMVFQEKEGLIYNGIVSIQRRLRLRKANEFQPFNVSFDRFYNELGQLMYIAVRLYTAEAEEDSLQKSNGLYMQLAVEHMYDIACFFHHDYRLKYISPSVEQILEYSQEALEGLSFFSLIHPDDRTEAETLFSKSPRELPENFSCRFRTKSGEYTKLLLVLRTFENNPEDGILPFWVLLHQASKDETDPAGMFSEVFDQLADAVAMVSLPSLEITKVNAHLLSTFRSAEETLEGRSFQQLFPDSPELTQLENVLLKASESFRQDMCCKDAQGNMFWANVAVSFFRSEQENFALLRITDISQQKDRESQLLLAREQAENTLKHREEFLSTMSHEIRTPLNAILGMTHLMLQGNPREDQLKLLQTLKFSGDSLTALINDVLDFSKIEAGKLEFARDDFNLREFLHSIKLTYKNLAQQKGLLFRTLLEEELPETVNGDVHRLGQILNNLLNNAIKFTEDGQVILSVYVDDEDEQHDTLLFEVADTGIGIPEEKQSVIFDPYQQASQRTSRYFGGTGLGLSIVKKLVDLSDGDIVLQSKEGQGTTFRVRLRFAKAANTSHTSPQSDRSFIHEYQPLEGLKVLYVEDVIPNQFLMEGLCDTWHIELDTALNGLEALEKVRQQHYDLILMDIQMPGMDGFETAREIRNLRDPHYNHIPILALSASISDRTRLRIRENGMDDYIAKPIIPQDLHQKLSHYSKVLSSTGGGASESREAAAEAQETVSPDQPDFSQLYDLYISDKEGYVTILQQILKLSQESALTIKQALESGQEERFRSSGHKIMSYVRLMKLHKLRELLENIKDHFDVYSPSPQAFIQSLDTHFTFFIEAVKREIEANS
jgi:PAS domain S-box-containing protein